MEPTIPIITVSIILVTAIFILVLRRRKGDQGRRRKKEPSAKWYQDLSQGQKQSKSAPNSKAYDWKLRETWEDYPAPDGNAYHTYCAVAFADSDRTFYYRTRNPELRVGDLVYVPVGYRYEKKVGRIISMKVVLGREAPYPLHKTKYIIGKVR
jgi:hypothetical protein